MIWGIVLVIRQLGKKRRFLKAIKSMGFAPVNDNRKIIEEIKNIFANTLSISFIRRVNENPREKLINYQIKGERISVTYKIPATEYRDIPRPVGLRETIQIVERKMVLSKLHFMQGDSKAFFAQTDDIETIRCFQEIKPINQKRSTVGWIICFSARTNYASTIIIYKRFTGHKKLLLNIAFKMANVKPEGARGLLPDFKNEFEVQLAEISNSQPIIDESTQQIILGYKRCFPEGVKLHLGNGGIWITGEEWLETKQVMCLIKLCNELLRT